MKKLTLPIFLFIPLLSFAQAPSPSDDGASRIFWMIVIMIVIGILIFLAIRELICWYYKINKMVENQEEIIRLLRKISGENVSDQNSETIIDPFHRK